MSDKDEFLQDVISIDVHTIDEHFRRVPAELAYYNQKYADAIQDHLIAKAELERVHGNLYLHYSEQTNGKGKPLTVAAITSSVEVDPDYQAARVKLIMAESAKASLKGKVDVVHSKKEMLVSLGAHLRTEMSDPMVKAQAANKRALIEPEY